VKYVKYSFDSGMNALHRYGKVVFTSCAVPFKCILFSHMVGQHSMILAYMLLSFNVHGESCGICLLSNPFQMYIIFPVG
jgi:hypothetical protein